jgi:hypothetical protein
MKIVRLVQEFEAEASAQSGTRIDRGYSVVR